MRAQPSTFVAALVAALIVPLGCKRRPPPVAPLEGEQPVEVGVEFPVDSKVLGERRNVTVFLPWSYGERSEPYPVLYLIDGGARQDYVPVAGFAALASLSGQFREFIVVGVQTNERRYELTSPSEVDYDLQQIPHNGGAELFRRFVVDELRPLIDERYHTSGEDLIMGESLAGLFIVETFLDAPGSFDEYIAISPSLWWREGAVARSADQRLQDPSFPADRALYLSVADEADIRAPLEVLVAALERHAPASLRWWYEPMDGEHHHSIYHPAGLRALRLLLGGG